MFPVNRLQDHPSRVEKRSRGGSRAILARTHRLVNGFQEAPDGSGALNMEKEDLDHWAENNSVDGDEEVEQLGVSTVNNPDTPPQPPWRGFGQVHALQDYKVGMVFTAPMHNHEMIQNRPNQRNWQQHGITVGATQTYVFSKMRKFIVISVLSAVVAVPIYTNNKTGITEAKDKSFSEWVGIRDARRPDEVKNAIDERARHVPNLIFYVNEAWRGDPRGEMEDTCFVKISEAVTFSKGAPIEYKGDLNADDTSRLQLIIHNAYTRSALQAGPERSIFTFTEDALEERLRQERETAVQDALLTEGAICDKRIEDAILEFRLRYQESGGDVLTVLPPGQHTGTAEDPLYRFDPPIPANPAEIQGNGWTTRATRAMTGRGQPQAQTRGGARGGPGGQRGARRGQAQQVQRDRRTA